MENLKRSIKCIIKPFLAVLLASTVGVASLAALFGSLLPSNSTENFAAAQEETATGLEFFTEKPENFKQQLKLSKYEGASSTFNSEDKELTIDFSSDYYTDSATFTVPDWYKDSQDNYACVTTDGDSSVLIRLEKNSDSYNTLLIEKEEEGENTYSSFRMPLDDNLLAYVETCALEAEENYTTIESASIYLDSEIVTYSDTGETTYYTSSDNWREYTDGQLEQLIDMTSKPKNKTKLKTLSTIMDKYYGGFDWEEEPLTDYIPEFLIATEGKSAFIGQEYGFVIETTYPHKEVVNGETSYYKLSKEGLKIDYKSDY